MTQRSFTKTTQVDQGESGFQFKVDRAFAQRNVTSSAQTTNGDKDLEIDRSGTLHKYAVFSKTLPHNSRGEVTSANFALLKSAAEVGAGFDSVPAGVGSARNLVNPRAAYSFVLTGLDPYSASMPAPPAFTSRTMASEMCEVYEHALNRTTTFAVLEDDMTPDTDADRAVANLNGFGADFLGKKDGGVVTRKTLFRGAAQGTELGPYISQYLYQDIPYGSAVMTQQYDVDAGTYGTDLASYLLIQNGTVYNPDLGLTGVPKYIHTPQVLGSYVHRDVVIQAYLNAGLILLGAGAPLDPNNPYLLSSREEGFGTWGLADVLSSVTGVAKVAIRAAWAQKWYHHLRLRPEVYACRVHHQEIGDSAYGIHADLVSSSTVAAIKAANGSGEALLPLQYPEGSPAHPSYPAGHAVFAGACVTVLKAMFDESTPITSLMTVLHSTDGDSTVAYGGSTAGMTVGTELNKLAANVAIGRDWAGVHYRSDGDWGMNLGEEIAIAYLRDQAASYHEPFNGFNLTKFDGTTVVITA